MTEIKSVQTISLSEKDVLAVEIAKDVDAESFPLITDQFRSGLPEDMKAKVFFYQEGLFRFQKITQDELEQAQNAQI